MTDKQIGFQIKQKRIAVGLNQKELAKLLELSPSEVSKIESGERKIKNIKTILKIKNVLGFSNEEIAYIFGITEEQFSYSVSSIFDNILSNIEINKLLLLNQEDLIKLRDYIIFLTSKNNIEEKEAIITLVKSYNKQNNS